MRLDYSDMALFGQCPESDKFSAVICDMCDAVVKPQGLRQHLIKRHNVTDLPTNIRTTTVKSSNYPSILTSTTATLASTSLSSNSHGHNHGHSTTSTTTSGSGGHHYSSGSSLNQNYRNSTQGQGTKKIKNKNGRQSNTTTTATPSSSHSTSSTSISNKSGGNSSNTSGSTGGNNQMLTSQLMGINQTSASTSSSQSVITTSSNTKSNTTTTTSHSSQNYNNLNNYNQRRKNRKVQKKISTQQHSSMIQQSKEREFLPDIHCGVPINDNRGKCLRSLTCKTHSLPLRRLVKGRSKSFDKLLEEQRLIKHNIQMSSTNKQQSNITTSGTARTTPITSSLLSSLQPQVVIQKIHHHDGNHEQQTMNKNQTTASVTSFGALPIRPTSTPTTIQAGSVIDTEIITPLTTTSEQLINSVDIDVTTFDADFDSNGLDFMDIQTTSMDYPFNFDFDKDTLTQTSSTDNQNTQGLSILTSSTTSSVVEPETITIQDDSNDDVRMITPTTETLMDNNINTLNGVTSSELESTSARCNIYVVTKRHTPIEILEITDPDELFLTVPDTEEEVNSLINKETQQLYNYNPNGDYSLAENDIENDFSFNGEFNLTVEISRQRIRRQQAIVNRLQKNLINLPDSARSNLKIAFRHNLLFDMNYFPSKLSLHKAFTVFFNKITHKYDKSILKKDSLLYQCMVCYGLRWKQFRCPKIVHNKDDAGDIFNDDIDDSNLTLVSTNFFPISTQTNDHLHGPGCKQCMRNNDPILLPEDNYEECCHGLLKPYSQTTCGKFTYNIKRKCFYCDKFILMPYCPQYIKSLKPFKVVPTIEPIEVSPLSTSTTTSLQTKELLTTKTSTTTESSTILSTIVDVDDVTKSTIISTLESNIANDSLLSAICDIPNTLPLALFATSAYNDNNTVSEQQTQEQQQKQETNEQQLLQQQEVQQSDPNVIEIDDDDDDESQMEIDDRDIIIGLDLADNLINENGSLINFDLLPEILNDSSNLYENLPLYHKDMRLLKLKFKYNTNEDDDSDDLTVDDSNDDSDEDSWIPRKGRKLVTSTDIHHKQTDQTERDLIREDNLSSEKAELEQIRLSLLSSPTTTERQLQTATPLSLTTLENDKEIQEFLTSPLNSTLTTTQTTQTTYTTSIVTGKNIISKSK